MTIETSNGASGSDEQLTPCPFTTIPTGTPLQIEKGAAGKRRRGSSCVLGTREGRHLLIDMPYDGAAPLFSTHTKEKIVVRFFMQGTVFGFSTRIAAVNFHPFGYAVCEFPKFVQKLSVRHHKRLQCSLPATVKLLAPPESAPMPRCEITEETIFSAPLAATVIDLAQGGCRLAIPILSTEILQQEFKYQKELEAKEEKNKDQDSASPEEEACTEADKTEEGDEPEDAPELSPLEAWAEKNNIEHEHLALYKPAILTERMFAGRRVLPRIEMPFPTGAFIENTVAEIRWNNDQPHYLAVGMKFEKMSDNTGKIVDEFLAFVEKYFAANITAG